MNSIEKTIIHDHIYSSNFVNEKDRNQVKSSLNKNSHAMQTCRRRIHKICDIKTDEDREDYSRRRLLNNESCRKSRLHRRTQHVTMMKKCIEYEDSNPKLRFKIAMISQVIDQLKEHLLTLIPNNIKQN